MKNIIRLTFFILLSVPLYACGTPQSDHRLFEEEPRTFYETLELDTPEEAVRTFTDAFRRDDFMTVYLILSTHAQFVMEQQVHLLNFGQLIQSDRKEEVFANISVFTEGIGAGEHMDAGWYFFDQLMLSAKNHSALLIDLSGEVRILKTSLMETAKGDDAVDVSARVEGIEGEVLFRMIQAPSGRWRVYQVIVAGGDEQMIPWAVPAPVE